MVYPPSVGYRPYVRGRRPAPVAGSRALPGVLNAPYNRFYSLAPGDSHGEQGGGGGGNYTSTQITNSTYTTESGAESLAAAYSGNKIQRAWHPNLGVGGTRTPDILAIPRPSDPSKSLLVTASNKAALVFLETGSNDANGTGGTNATDLDNAYNLVVEAIAALTTPGRVYAPYGQALPLYNNLPKTIVLVCNFRRGVKPDGSLNFNLSAADATNYYNYSRRLLKLAYNSGDATANPNVIACDTFEIPELADFTSGNLYYNKAGGTVDGIHFASPSAYWGSKKVGETVAAALDNSVNFARIPDTTTVANFLNSNPCLLTGGTAGTISANSNTVTGAALPSGTSMTIAGGGLNVDISYTTLPGNRGRQMKLTITGTATTRQALTFRTLTPNSTVRGTIDLSTDYIRCNANVGFKINSGSASALYSTLLVSVTAAMATLTRTGIVSPVVGAGGYNNGGLFSQFAPGNAALTVSFDPITVMPPVSDHPTYAPPAGTQPSSTGLVSSIIAEFEAGMPVNCELTVSEWGIFKTTNVNA